MASGRPSIALLVLSALLLLPSAPALRAQTADQRQFIERDVPAEAAADDAVQARAAAIAKGQALALQRLMARLSGADPSRLPAVPENQIDRYVRSFEIEQEQVGAKTYSAELTVTFRPEAVQELLQNRGLSYAVIEALPTVVLAYGPGGDPFLDGDPWRSAVLDAAARSAAVEAVLPLGDAQDLAISQPSALAGDPGTLQPLAERYGTQAALIAAASLLPSADGAQALEVKGQYLGRDGSIRELPAQTVPARADGQPDYDAAARTMLASVDSALAGSVVRSDAIVELLSVTVPLADLAAWVQIRQALADMPEIRTTKVERISRQKAQLVLGHVGSVESLRSALQRRGLELSQENEGWRLLRAGDRPVSTIGG
jgi:hypothetical protein